MSGKQGVEQIPHKCLDLLDVVSSLPAADGGEEPSRQTIQAMEHPADDMTEDEAGSPNPGQA